MMINDNVDVAALLPERVGLHIGQEDAKLGYARQRLGPHRIIGLSVHSVDEARAALDSDADYVGVGPCWPTKSKEGVSDDDALMLRGAADILASLRRDPATTPPGKRTHVPSVLIGGINVRTAFRTLFGASSEHAEPDGIAVISAIVSRRDPDVAAKELHSIVTAFRRVRQDAVSSSPTFPTESKVLIQSVQELLRAYHTRYESITRKDDASCVSLPRPLVHTITSHVSSNFSANMTLAFSASPIMSHEYEEVEPLSHVYGSLVLNIGTISPDSRKGMARAGPAANNRGKPVVLDPVGVGATPFRHRTVQSILNETQVTLIKGNAAEIATLCNSNDAQTQGVDSVGQLTSAPVLARRLARQEGAFVLLTGEVDYLTDGNVVLESRCGTPMLGRITASGCSLGCVVAAGMAAAQTKYGIQLGNQVEQRQSPPRLRHELMIGALAGLLTYTIAAERAAALPSVRGPGSFIPALLDEVASFDPACLELYKDRLTFASP